MKKSKNVYIKDKLYCEIFTIGYDSKGEGVVVFIKSEEKIEYTIVIDSYQVQDRNETIELLKKNRIKNIDCLCWTHPDEDHSIGIDDLLINYCSKNTIIVLPSYLTFSNCRGGRRIKKALEIIKDKQKGKNRFIVKEVSNYCIIDKMFFSAVNERIDLTIESIAPNSEIVLNRMGRQAPYACLNDYSIVLVVKIKDTVLFFTGDVENNNINCFEEYYFNDIKQIDYFKIPHHCSKSASNILELFNYSKCESAVTTAYKAHHLPDKELLKRYLYHTTNLFCTKSLEDNNENGYGIVKHSIELFNNSMNIELFNDSRYIDNKQLEQS